VVFPGDAKRFGGMLRNWRSIWCAFIFFTTAGAAGAHGQKVLTTDAFVRRAGDSSTVREHLAELVNSLRAVSPRTRWVRPENLHVTLKFIGEVPETQLASIRTALAQLRSDRPVTLGFGGLDFSQMNGIRAFSGRASRLRRI